MGSQFSLLKTVLGRFSRFTSVGAVGTGFHYFTLIVLVEGARSDPVLATTIGAVVGALVNYRLNRQFTFRSSKPHREALTKFFVVATVALCLNATAVFWLVSIVGLQYLIAQIISTALVLIVTFSGNYLWTFNDAR